MNDVNSGLQICKSDASPADRNCGYVNGAFACVDAVKPGECKVLDGGGRICGASAPVPPVPDNGTPGVPATPDEQVQMTNSAGEQTTVNYYNNTTVQASSRPAGSTGENPYDEPTASESEAAESAGDGLHCDPSSDSGCSAEGEGEGMGEAADPRSGWQCWAEGEGAAASAAACIGTAAQTLWNRLQNESSLVSVANATAAAWPSGGGACPSAPVVLLEQTFDFWEVPCSFLDDVASILGPLFLLLWSIVGLRILLTIPGAD